MSSKYPMFTSDSRPSPEVRKRFSCSTQLNMKFYPVNGNSWHFNIYEQDHRLLALMIQTKKFHDSGKF